MFALFGTAITLSWVLLDNSIPDNIEQICLSSFSVHSSLFIYYYDCHRKIEWLLNEFVKLHTLSLIVLIQKAYQSLFLVCVWLLFQFVHWHFMQRREKTGKVTIFAIMFHAQCVMDWVFIYLLCFKSNYIVFITIILLHQFLWVVAILWNNFLLTY